MLQVKKTTSLVEGGILAAIAIVFALASVYIPILGIVINMIWPVPFLLLGARHGLKMSLMCLAAAGIIISILINPLQGISSVLGLGFIGIALGYAIRHEFSPMKSMVVGVTSSFISKVVVILISIFVMGVNPITMQAEMAPAAIDQAMKVYEGFNVLSPEQLTEMRNMLDKTLGMLKYIMPAAFFLASVIDTYINFIIAGKILARMGKVVPSLAPFREWRLPIYIPAIYAVSMVLVSLYHTTPDNILYQIGANLNVITNVILLIQGISIVYFFIHHYQWPGIAKTILFILLFSSQMVSQVIVFTGLLDSLFDYRKIANKKPG